MTASAVMDWIARRSGSGSSCGAAVAAGVVVLIAVRSRRAAVYLAPLMASSRARRAEVDCFLGIVSLSWGQIHASPPR
ncbi:hypothetical protein C1N81_04165 (plasmid) [Streptomyces sp. SGAir0957]